MGFERARAILEQAVRDGVCPAAVAEVGDSAAVRWRHAEGRLTADPAAAPAEADTVFDLASLTKVVATTTLAMQLVQTGRLELDEPVAGILPPWQSRDRESVTVFDLLAHSAGLPATLPLWTSCRSRAEVEAAIAACPLDYTPGTRSVYSDLGFILLGFVIERVVGRDLSMQFAECVLPALTPALGESDPWSANDLAPSPATLGFLPPNTWLARTAPTGFDSWRGRMLAGDVHDRNAAVLGGVGGHAGLFGTAPAVGAFARAVLRTLAAAASAEPTLGDPAVAGRFVARAGTPGSSRALGWDTMLPTSSCGTRLSTRSIGHTGYTGTSLWIDLDRRVYVVLLTNRVGSPDAGARFGPVRPAFHDAVVEGL